MKTIEFALSLCALLPLLGCAHTQAGKPEGIFGRLADGTEVGVYTLSNKNGMEAKIISYGAAVVSLKVPDRQGRLADVVLGYENLDGYLKGDAYFGCVVGRYGNRIGKARFSLAGKEYRLASNNGRNHLHGGIRGFDKVVWRAERANTPAGPALVMRYKSPDGEEGYPGTLDCTVVYTLTDKNELKVDYTATTDKETVVNLTQHSYFNLKGAGMGDILDHVLAIQADGFVPIDAESIPLGDIRPVKGTPFDFTEPRKIGEGINADDEQIKNGKGYDHNWVLRGQDGSLALAARVTEESSGRVMEVYTTEPGIQFYSGNFLDDSDQGKNGIVYRHRYGLCLETQHYPDSPNRPDFPSVTLKPGQTYSTRTVYKFLAE